MTDYYEGLNHRGAYVAWDGADGSGKSTNMARIAAATNARIVREPGGTATGARIRELLLGRASVGLTRESEVLLFSADRNLLLHEIIIPTLAAGTGIASDRSYVSTLAYQCYGGNVPLEYVFTATQLALGGHRPDMSLILDVPYEVSLERRSGRNAGDRFEDENAAFHDRVRNGFLEVARAFPETTYVIDASGTQEEVFDLAYAVCGKMLQDGVYLNG